MLPAIRVNGDDRHLPRFRLAPSLFMIVLATGTFGGMYNGGGSRAICDGTGICDDRARLSCVLSAG